MQVRRHPTIGGRIGVDPSDPLSGLDPLTNTDLADDVTVDSGARTVIGWVVDHDPAGRVRATKARRGPGVDHLAALGSEYGHVS